MSKPVPKRIPSDDCVITVDGISYYPHADEWVEIFPIQSVREIRLVASMARLGIDVQSAQDDLVNSGDNNDTTNVTAQARLAALADAQLSALCEILAERVIAWNWTDLRGLPYAQPDGTAAQIEQLTADELAWLIRCVQPESSGDRKNGSRPLPITYSATDSRTIQKVEFSTGRSRTKR